MELTFTTIEKFKQMLERKASVESMAAIKTGPAIVRAIGEPGDRTLDFTISTSAVDRDNDTIDQNGWKLDNFIRGGSVLWAHDAKTPAVARPLATWLEGGALRSKAQFTPKGVYPFGYMVYEMYRDGYMRGCSVSFLPIKYAEATDRGGWMPLDFQEQELLEWSCTPVPSNPEAVSDAKSKGIDVSPMIEWAESRLDGETPGGLLVPRDALEKLHRAAKGAAPVSVEIKTPDDGGSPAGGAGGGKDQEDGRLLRTPDPTASAALKGIHAQIQSACADIEDRCKVLLDDLAVLREIVGDGERSREMAESLREVRDAISAIVDPQVVVPSEGAQVEAFCLELPSPVRRHTPEFSLDPEMIKEAVAQVVQERAAGLRVAIRENVDGAIRRARGKVD